LLNCIVLILSDEVKVVNQTDLTDYYPLCVSHRLCVDEHFVSDADLQR